MLRGIVISDARPRKRGYTRKGIRAFFTYTGSHSKTILYGLITTDGRGMFRQYDKFNQHAFADFLRQAVYRFKKICLIMDKASQHRAVKIRKLVERTDGLEIIFLPTATPDLSAIETYWRDLKRAVLDVSYTSLSMLREAITRYTRYKKPNLTVENFLYRVI